MEKAGDPSIEIEARWKAERAFRFCLMTKQTAYDRGEHAAHIRLLALGTGPNEPAKLAAYPEEVEMAAAG